MSKYGDILNRKRQDKKQSLEYLFNRDKAIIDKEYEELLRIARSEAHKLSRSYLDSWIKAGKTILIVYCSSDLDYYVTHVLSKGMRKQPFKNIRSPGFPYQYIKERIRNTWKYMFGLALKLINDEINDPTLHVRLYFYRGGYGFNDDPEYFFALKDDIQKLKSNSKFCTEVKLD